MKPALVIMAAGMGSRYGGLKQIDPVGPKGEVIIDYAIYDAIKVGFDRVIFIIKEEIEEAFKEAIGNRIEEKVEVSYVFQDIDNLPEGFERPEEREKPWGTGQAILSCKDTIDTPFVVINADDFYGRSSYKSLYDFLTKDSDMDKKEYAMPGYILNNTLTEHGHVARGVCVVDQDGYLEEIVERVKIERFDDGVKFEDEEGIWHEISEDSSVSMNMWAFKPSIFEDIEEGFIKFLDDLLNKGQGDKLTSEFYIPNLVGDLIKEDKAKVKVIPSNERWFGVTYREDREKVEKALAEKVASGEYPEKL